MNNVRGSIIPPSVDLFHDRALQERSANTRHDHVRASSRQAKAYRTIERPLSIRTDPSVQLYRGSVRGTSDQRGLAKPKLLPFEKEQVFQQLWMRLWACKSFAKYRHDQRRGQRKAKDQIWSDRNEFLFFRALVEFWPTGRVQQVDERFEPKKNSGKAEFGRNELIALWMGQYMGHEVRRKEISSHLQVTKAKIKSELTPDAYVLYWLGALESKNDEHKYLGALSRLVPSRVQRDTHVLEPVQFNIRIRETDVYGNVDKTAHTLAYSTDAAKREDQYLAAMPAWRREYPDLSKMLDDAHLWGVEIMLVDCPLSLINATELRDIRSEARNNNCDVDLSIQNKFRIRNHISPGEQWTCSTTFFQRGEIVSRLKHRVPVPIMTDALHTHWDGKYQTLMVPFKSDYWLSMLCGFADRLDSDAADSVEQDVEDMLAVQEIRMRPRSEEDSNADGDSDEASEWTTLLVLLWKFHADPSAQAGATTWRSVFLPFEPLQGAKADVSKSAVDDDSPLADALEQASHAVTDLEPAFELQPRNMPPFNAHEAVFDLDLASVPLDTPHYQHVNGRGPLLQSGLHAGGAFDFGASFESPLGLDFSGVPATSTVEQMQQQNHTYDPSLFGTDFASLSSATVLHQQQQQQLQLGPDSASTQMSTQPSQDSGLGLQTRTNTTSSHSGAFCSGEPEPGAFIFSSPFPSFQGFTADSGASSGFSQAAAAWLQHPYAEPAHGKIVTSSFPSDGLASPFVFLDSASPTSSQGVGGPHEQARAPAWRLQQLAQAQRMLTGVSSASPAADDDDRGRQLAFTLPSQRLPSAAVLPSQPASQYPLLPAGEGGTLGLKRQRGRQPRQLGDADYDDSAAATQHENIDSNDDDGDALDGDSRRAKRRRVVA